MRRLLLFVLFTAQLLINISAKELVLTQQELDYIDSRSPIVAVIIDGAAPLMYVDSHGEVKGISIELAKHIARKTGLEFTFVVADRVEDFFALGSDLAIGATRAYSPPPYVTLSHPYLTSETILVVNRNASPARLEQSTFAQVRGGEPPLGVSEDHIRYYDSREQTLLAVEKREVDYTYSNAYSAAFYALHHDFQNIVLIPRSIETRDYSFGLFNDDEILLSILNKAIDSIEPETMQTLILQVSSQVERNLTWGAVFNEYGTIILTATVIVLVTILTSIFFTVRANTKLNRQNSRYKALSAISNEYLFEYIPQKKKIISSELLHVLIDDENHQQVIPNLLDLLEHYDPIHPPFLHIESEAEDKIFRVVLLNIIDNKGRTQGAMGKLVDVSKESREKAQLLDQLQYDGLTSIYNAQTTKDLISQRLSEHTSSTSDALFVIDTNKFKETNDTYGHLVGDKVLQYIAQGLQRTFRSDDIVGRIGGDEFCVYMQNYPLGDYLLEKIEYLSEYLSRPYNDIPISVSIGVTNTLQGDTYETLFQRADDALYEAKHANKPYAIHLQTTL
ncbi:MAG: diguanylate cyclase domain-containing protein [Sphaerochaetaceae bacterium]